VPWCVPCTTRVRIGPGGHEGDDRVLAGVQHFYIQRVDDANVVHHIVLQPRCGAQLQAVAHGSILEDAKIPVTMAGDAGIAHLPRPRGAGDPRRTALHVTVEDRHFQAQ